jgi:hypothetical protein
MAAEIRDLTLDQQRILLVLCDAADDRFASNYVGLVCTQGHQPIRETSTGMALVRKGLAERGATGRFTATAEGYWLGDGLRVLDRLGKIPARRTE